MKVSACLLALILLGSSQVCSQRSTWEKALNTGQAYTVRFDTTGLYTIEVYNNGNLITDEGTKKSLLEGQIDNAISAWCAATDYMVQMSRVSSGGDFRIELETVNPVESLGQCQEHIDINKYWGFSVSGTQGERIHFYSAVVHEVGHLFIGSHHATEDNTSVMWAPYEQHKWTYNGTYGGLNQADKDTVQELYNPLHDVTLKIITAKDTVGATLKIDYETNWETVGRSGYSNAWRKSTFPHHIEVQNGQTVQVGSSSYATEIEYWKKGTAQEGSANPHTIIADETGWEVHLDLRYDVTFNNSLPGEGSNGNLKVADTVRSSGYIAHVWNSGNSVTAQALTQTIDGVEYTFSRWEDDSTMNPRTFTVTDHATHTAGYTAKPLPPTYLNIVGDPGDQIQLTWTDNPNQYVTKYMICRSPDKNEPFVLVDSVNSGVETWTDPYYTITAGYTDLLVGYVVLAKYVHEGFVSLSDSASVHTYGELTPPPKVETAQATGTLTPTEYAVGSYPNPFNPWTIIRFELVEPAEVLLEIYDVMGRRVAVLVDAARSAGSHSTAWHATDDAGASVASGMYLYRFSAKPTSGAKPYVTTGKLVYAK